MEIDNKNIVIVGGTGLIGRHLVKVLLSNGYHPIVLSRNPSNAKSIFSSKVEIQHWDGKDYERLSTLINGVKGIVNFAGNTIAIRWTRKNKESILKSRIDTTLKIVNAINLCEQPPEVLIQGSAIGYYHFNSPNQVDETSLPGTGFLSQVVLQWEQSVAGTSDKCRLVLARTGIVLSKNGGFLSKIVPSIKFWLGGWFGDGKQHISWIHIDDYTKAILFLIESKSSYGVYNLVAPNSTTYKNLVLGIGKELNRPIWLPIPTFLIRLIFGSMSNEVLLSSQNVVPKRLITEGFKFNYNIQNALKDLLA